MASIGDVFRDVTARDGSKNVKFPEKLLKVLENRLENIAMGKDSVCVLSCQAHPTLPLLPRSLLLLANSFEKAIRTSCFGEQWLSSMASSRWIRFGDR
jgi:hypothetical protein